MIYNGFSAFFMNWKNKYRKDKKLFDNQLAGWYYK